MKVNRIAMALLVAVIACGASAQIKLKAKSPVGILTQKRVATDLQLTTEQQDKIKKLNDEYRSAMGAIQGSAPSSPEDAQMQIDEAGAAIEKKILQLLTKEQQERRTQLVLQLGGPSTLIEKPYAEKLKLTDTQKTSIEGIFEEYMEAIMELQQTETDLDKLSVKRNSHANKYREMAEKVLTEEQAKVLIEMKGKPIAA